MKRHKLRKRALTALLALSLFSTPLLTAQAAGAVDYSDYNTAGTAGYSGLTGSNPYGSPAELIFDTGNGPGVNASSVPGWRALTQTGRYYVIGGTSGQPLNSIAPFAGNMAAFPGASSSLCCLGDRTVFRHPTGRVMSSGVGVRLYRRALPRLR